MSRICYQINLQPSLGGGEIYTRFMTEALQRLGWKSVLIIAKGTSFWEGFMPPDLEYRFVWDVASLEAALPGKPSLILTHSALPEDLAPFVARSHRLCGVVHMPLYDRQPRGLSYYHRLFAVSDHVRNSALSRGLTNVHCEPLLAVADIAMRGKELPVVARSPYEWDKRKYRDRLFGFGERLFRRNDPGIPYVPQSGLNLGIVSRITPIKQFPEMFSILAPVLSDFPDIHLDIFGAGGYASVRDLMKALGPVRERVRWWGPQADVSTVYRGMDYVVSGLPEKEALGLNLIEAQMCGTPVLAIDAPPFTETVIDQVSGYLFCDPRQDQGYEFRQLLARISGIESKPNPMLAVEHLARFSQEAFDLRLQRALNMV